MPNPARFALSSVCGLFVAGTALLLSGCSAERHNVVARAYQNITARDNGYFLAREKMRAEEAKLYKERPNDYNRVLPLFPVVDSVKALSLTAAMDEVVKKASIPVVRRSTSDWTDDAYILIGKTRFYKREFEEATKTFKYVNTTSKDANARHEALIWLMRTYMVTKQWDNASSVSDLLDKEEGTEANARELFLTRAEYYLHEGEEQLAIANIRKAIPYIPKKDERSRTRYILAQLYQNNGQDKEAYAELNKILKRNPPYELDFFSKLMLGQVSDLNQQDRTRLDKYFSKLLKDPKNKEYRDKIYYEMARLDYRQQHFDSALKLVNQSVRTNTTNKAQRGYAYLLAGRIYYENLRKYQLAAAYYDSTTQSLPRETPGYAAIQERATILKDFAQQLTIIQTQDSLLTLVRLDTAALRGRLTAYADAEMLRRKREAERQAALAARSANQTGTGQDPTRTGNSEVDPLAFATNNTGRAWYFDNPQALSTARGDFERRWGNRPLTDNWRLSSLATTGAPTPGAGAPVTVGGAGNSAINPAGNASAQQATPQDEQAALIAEYRQSLPFTASQQQQSEAQIQEALFALGAIYNQQLREPVNAIQTYEQLLQRFPKGPHTVETYYSLYLLYKEQNDPKAEQYAQRLRTEFPNSSYARLVADPEYLRRASLANEQMTVRLDSAFAFYKKQEFRKANATLLRARKLNPQTDLDDRAEYLAALLIIRTQPPAAHKAALTAFVKKYPESALAPRAQELLQSYTKYESGQLAGALASTEKPVVSFFRPGEVDNRMRIDYDEPLPKPVVPTPAQPKPETPKEAAPAASPAGTSPGAQPAAPATGKPTDKAPDKTATPPASPSVPASATPATAPAPAPEPSPYAFNLAAPHAVAIVFPKDAAAFNDLQAQLTAYNNRFFKASNLQIQVQPLGATQQVVVVQPFANNKVAQNYALKLRGPQGPLLKLRNAGYQSFQIGIDNLPVLLTRGNLEEYQRFAQPVYSGKN
ncbi:tetratricopeptide repeat protein [Hymenobacter sp. 15J16-1T3B]|uniref:type IX secretion system periplasmic lipoprotein PorW/SprE n=1 Tax=Hymenobacter sp. 15J16-1T3B TaxID=2886941 RepID=UPI001D1253C0|nr:tetratricopeptide repeat protein [Hymenobacter sp. 15J16-1T3B]MCC3155786.1 tetratricopeptide repeat protein [Hymenobacter sp. 15J16-1T3B]